MPRPRRTYAKRRPFGRFDPALQTFMHNQYSRVLFRASQHVREYQLKIQKHVDSQDMAVTVKGTYGGVSTGSLRGVSDEAPHTWPVR